MKHTVLARKWRPKKFKDLVGQQNSVKILTNIIKNNRLHHAYLLTGTRGVGKTTIARIIAKAINCLNPIDGEPCTNCENCIAIDKGNFVDVIEIDAASNTGVDNIRELIDNARYAPTSGKYKVYIIDEVHMLSKSAFNAMLKTLEEPPEHVIFILATTDLQKVPATILSRCLQLKLRNISCSEIEQHLASILKHENKEFEPQALSLIAVAASGSMRDALSILDQAIAFSDKIINAKVVQEMLGLTGDDIIENLLDAISQLNSVLLMKYVDEIHNSGADLESVLFNLQQKLCKINLVQLGAIPNSSDYSKYIDKISINDVQLYFEIANLGLLQLNKVRDKYPVFVMTMLRMLAFNIGTDEQKTIVLNSGNFCVDSNNNTQIADAKKIIQPTIEASNNIKPSEIIVSTEKIEASSNSPYEIVDDLEPNIATTSPVLQIDEVKNINHDSNVITTITETEPNPSFTGNWFELIAALKVQLGPLYPFVENAELKHYSEKNIDLIVDERYKTAFNSKLIEQLTQILCTHFKTQILVSVEFAAKVSNTLKEKNIQEQEAKQLLAEGSIVKDEYLLQVCESLSAKIVPGSIKPVG